MKILSAVTPTEPYLTEIECLIESAANWGYTVISDELPIKESWMATCLTKPALILENYNTWNDHVLWLDADIRFNNHIDHIEVLANEYDFMCFERSECRLHKQYWWLNAGVMFFGNTPKGRELLETWVELCEEADPNSFMPEQKALAQAYHKVNPKMFSLPEIYNMDWDKPEAESASLIHQKASRKYRPYIDNGEEVAGYDGGITVDESRIIREKFSEQ